MALNFYTSNAYNDMSFMIPNPANYNIIAPLQMMFFQTAFNMTRGGFGGGFNFGGGSFNFGGGGFNFGGGGSILGNSMNNAWSNWNTSSTSSSSSKSAEETVAENDLKAKYKKLHDILIKYAESKPNDDKCKVLAVELKRIKNSTSSALQENYDKLKKYYEENKTGVQKYLLGTEEFTDAGFDNSEYELAEQLVSEMNTAGKTITLNKYLKDANATFGNCELKDDINVLELYSNIIKTGQPEAFYKLYHKAWDSDNYDYQQKVNHNKIYEAIGKALRKKVKELLDNESISETTKAMLQTVDINPDSQKEKNKNKIYKPETLEKMYYWCRVAEAEILEANYAEFNEDFKNDTLFGKNAIVNKAKDDAKKEITKYKPEQNKS